MKNKIKAIRIKVPKETTLADGLYYGTWGAYSIELKSGEKTYELETEEGVRGMGFKVVVEVINGVATFEEVKN